ncbi:hypothetical protein BVRB_5g118290 [Beta vulgaris subsp. vulgaris]|nr:hypothetical protein BVRB_5g118290 [Beta vulgaris subsp. vulgaris]
MATNTITNNNVSFLLHPNLSSTVHRRRNNHHQHHHNLNHITSISFPKPTKFSLPPFKISLKKPLKPYSLKPLNSSLNPFFPQSPQNPQFSPNSTKTLSTLFSLFLSLSSKIAQFITTHFQNLKFACSSLHLQTLQFLHDNVICTVGPLFLSTFNSDHSTGLVNTPLLTSIASGLAKWLDIYSGILMIRVLLTWFPNTPWDRQPLSAIRDLTDPFLSLFRAIVPPVFKSVDISPLLAFAVLGTLGSILNVPRP